MLDPSIAKSSGIVFGKHNNDFIISDILDDIMKYFYRDSEFYNNMSSDNYRAIVSDCQDELNRKDYARKICENIKNSILEYIGEEKFYIQSNLYLRAARNCFRHDSEAIDWHRETFYGSNMDKSVNIWTPIKGVDDENTLKFIPFSQNIDEADIVTVQSVDPVTKKGSFGHKIGFLYAPKTIVSGVNLENDAAMIVPISSSAIFPGLLIHGAAKNKNNNIRFSVDFRILPSRYYIDELSKQFHFSSNKPYFELY